jgi:hypothetical protein
MIGRDIQERRIVATRASFASQVPAQKQQTLVLSLGHA